MKTSNSLKNAMWAIIVFSINMLISFFARKVFIKVLGIEYNGLNGLFLSIISMLNIAELGIGTTIIYKLYKPIHTNDKEQIKSLLSFYRKCYLIIAGVILLLGLLLIPFIDKIVGTITITVNIYAVYLLFLADSVFSYLLSYKRSLLIASQKDRTIKQIHLGIIIFLNAIQILLLYKTHNYYLFLITKIIFTIVENLLITIMVNKEFPFIKEKSKELDAESKKELATKIKAMFLHQIGGFIVNGTDNILISVLFSVAIVGYYSNYMLILTALISLVSSVFSAITSSVGNLLVSSDKDYNLKIFNNIYFINFLIALYTSCLYFTLIQGFIVWWIGAGNLLDNSLVIVLTTYYYFRIMKFTTTSFKDAAGIYYSDRFMPIIESIINIILSIIFAKMFGVIGILMGTISSTLFLYIYSYPKYVYKRLFEKPKIKYYELHLKYLLLSISFIIVITFINKLYVFDNFIIEAIKTIAIVTLLFIVLIYALFHNSSSFKYFEDIAIRIIKKKRGNKNEKN